MEPAESAASSSVCAPGAESVMESKPSSQASQAESAAGVAPSRRTKALPSTIEGLLAAAYQFKEQGNELFKKQEWKKACVCYKRIFLYTKGLLPEANEMIAMANAANRRAMSEEHVTAIRDLTVAANANLAQVYLRVKDNRMAKHYCEEVLALSPNHVKALFRKGQACMALGDLTVAKQCLEAAEQLEPDNASVKSALQTWKAAYKKHNAQQSKLYSKMMQQPTHKEVMK